MPFSRRVWITRDALPDVGVEVWKFEPRIVGGIVWWADCPNGVSPIAWRFSRLSVRDCVAKFGAAPMPGEVLEYDA
jgi:hypothetical protein